MVGFCFWIRIHGAEKIPSGQFTETDAYLYHWQAKIIHKHGVLPAKDMHRWLPYGRDNRQLLPLYSYVIAYTHKVLGGLFPNLTLYHIQLYAPVVCFTLGLGILFLFLSRIYGLLFASIVTILLATIPGSVERSALGFGDRDAWCWLLGVSAITSYLWKEQMETGRGRLIVTILSGITVFLGGLSWEGFGFLLAIIVCLELWKFCTTDTEEHLKEYILWMFMFVPLLFLISPAYRSGYGFSTHLFALMLLPVTIILAMRSTRYLLLKYVKNCTTHSRKIAWGLTTLAITAATAYFISQSHNFETTAFAFKESLLMQNVGELMDPEFTYWTDRYGAIFVLGSIGLILTSTYFGTAHGTLLGIGLFLFVGTTFFRDLVNRWTGEPLCDTLFVISFTLTAIGLGIASFRKTPQKNELVILAMFTWFLIWVALARSGKRYDFFIGMPLTFGTASLLWLSPSSTTPEKSLKENLITVGIATTILCGILFLTPIGGHFTRLTHAAFVMRPALPGKGDMTDALTWIQKTLPQSSVVAADWNYGTQLNVLSGVKSIIDSDHYIPHWIHLYYRHVHCAQTEKEALEFLKTHNATHLMLTEWGTTYRAQTYSKIGSKKNNDRLYGFLPLQQVNTPIGTQYRMAPTYPIAPFEFIDFDRTKGDEIMITIPFKKGDTRKITVTKPTTLKMVDIQNGGLALYFDNNTRIEYAYYIPPEGWNSLSVKLFLRKKYSDAFVPIYPVDQDSNAKIKLWEIQYPPNINEDDKYLLTEPKNKP